MAWSSGNLKLARDAILTVCGLLGLSGILQFLAAQTEPAPQTDFELGLAADYAVGSRTVFPQVPALLQHTPDGFTALSLICTHLGCTVASQPEGLVCPCHGSRFDLDGKVIHGPANQPLNRLRVEITSDGEIHVHTA
ncbi:MAG: Rieske (2Fe-2S) protein [Anaerolineales bacterium]